jgi:addiction module HigA family antidote
MRTTSTSANRIEPHPSMATHPGEVLRVMLEDGLHLSVSEAARQIGVSRQQLHNVLSGRAGMTPEMALLVGRMVGSPRLWLNIQSRYDLAKAQERMPAERLERVPEYDRAS